MAELYKLSNFAGHVIDRISWNKSVCFNNLLLFIYINLFIFCFVLFCFVLFCFVLFCFVLFCFVLVVYC